jgi:hypothetical protein
MPTPCVRVIRSIEAWANGLPAGKACCAAKPNGVANFRISSEFSDPDRDRLIGHEPINSTTTASFDDTETVNIDIK